MSGPSARGGAAPAGEHPGGAAPVWSASRARRVVLAAQGLAGPRPAASARRVRAVMDRLGVVQIDSVDVLARAHLMPFHSRLDGVDPSDVERLTVARPHRFTEAWAHEASIVPAERRTALVALQSRTWPLATGLPEQERRAAEEQVLALLARHGPLTARELEARGVDAGAREDGWGWNWSRGKRVLEHLFATGAVVAAGRTASFERRYALPSLLWAEGRGGLTPVPPDPAAGDDPALAAALPLTAAAVRALGVASTAAVADYHRLPVALTRRALAVLQERGQAVPVRVRLGEGPAVPAWADPRARAPRTASAVALVNPFDPLVFHRPRVERLFGVRYRIGIYTPAARRERGYYPLLLVQGERLTAQVDLKADRRADPPVLRVRGAWTEDPAAVPGPRDPAPTADEVAAALVGELRRLACWTGAAGVVVDADAPGDLVAPVRGRLRADGPESPGP
ncbi:winged helix-turn-helix domain-containing protein [Micrococcus sp.]|uniref:winged helix-turn-helix domain-containing protein n=1 Tax=Micrococcus sp. TaxID=1271 RepID=UPI0026DD76D3|nr:crosslink repair DNA glycosylase YcaQ family protein [Micrococcus sp.]MDO4239936.1 crosslink repair DNA glycosylase YcaQ family protein [Micrococcus sp.]